MKNQPRLKALRTAVHNTALELVLVAPQVAAEVVKLAREVACALRHWRMFIIHVALQPLPVQLGLMAVVLGFAEALAGRL